MRLHFRQKMPEPFPSVWPFANHSLFLISALIISPISQLLSNSCTSHLSGLHFHWFLYDIIALEKNLTMLAKMWRPRLVKQSIFQIELLLNRTQYWIFNINGGTSGCFPMAENHSLYTLWRTGHPRFLFHLVILRSLKWCNTIRSYSLFPRVDAVPESHGSNEASEEARQSQTVPIWRAGLQYKDICLATGAVKPNELTSWRYLW